MRMEKTVALYISASFHIGTRCRDVLRLFLAYPVITHTHYM